jgi:hypothetical protein
VKILHEKQKMLPLKPPVLCGQVRSIKTFLATCSLQFAKTGSAAAQSQQEKNNTINVQRGRAKITGFMWGVES